MSGVLLFVGIMFLLWLGRSIFIPILIAAFVWYLINAIASYYRKVLPYQYEKQSGKKPAFKSIAFDWVAAILSILTFLIFIAIFVTQIRPMFSELIAALPDIQNKFAQWGQYLSGYFHYTLSSEDLPNITKIVANLGSSVAGIATSLGMVIVYMVFMFIEQSTFHKKFAALFPNKQRSKKMRYIFNSIDGSMKKYIFVKTAMAGVTAILSYFWLLYLGLPFAGVWAFIVFITSYIPTIGAIVACTLPIGFAFVMGDGLTLPILVAIGLIAIQVIFGNIIEPKLTGKTLNLSTLAILINLVFWGMIWGIAGMFFSVPLLVATYIITAQFDSTRWIAILLSADGQVPDKSGE